MDLGLTSCLGNYGPIRKFLLNLKPTDRSGLVLRVHHLRKDFKLRFLQAVFNTVGNILAIASNDNDIFIIDFIENKFWYLAKIEDTPTVITFFSLNSEYLFIGQANGIISIVNYIAGYVVENLTGHKSPIVSISFTYKETKCAISASKTEGIIWNLDTNTKMQVLNLNEGVLLKFIYFMPVTDNILACYQDESIQIWDFSSYTLIKDFPSQCWDNNTIKNVSFTKNGASMVVATYMPTLILLQLHNWKVSKIIQLPAEVLSVRSVDFIPQLYDGGSNRILVILSGGGVIYFYNLIDNVIISTLKCYCEILKYSFSEYKNLMAVLLDSGEALIYDISQYIQSSAEIVTAKAVVPKVKLRKSSNLKVSLVKYELDGLLDDEKLYSILHEFWEYPDMHRTKIWETLLKIPYNIQQYNRIINRITITSFPNLYEHYPVEQSSVKCLRKLLNNLVTWCQFFACIDYLPVFTFPFVKLFQNKPVACFEVICTIIMNWCQHWFQYYPLLPVNILAMGENLILEHDPELLNHFHDKSVSPNIYIWTLLESAFSEVLSSKEWLQFWDHVISNESSFLICCAAAFNIIHRSTLLSISSQTDFELFYHKQNPNDMRQFLMKSYWILTNTAEDLHPRQYLKRFRAINTSEYPQFVDYPKAVIDCQLQEMQNMTHELKELETDEVNLLSKKEQEWIKKNTEIDYQNEENVRNYEMKKAFLEQLQVKKEEVKEHRQRLDELKKNIINEEKDMFDNIRCKLRQNHLKAKTNQLELQMRTLNLKDFDKDYRQLKNELQNYYLNLLQRKHFIELQLSKIEDEKSLVRLNKFGDGKLLLQKLEKSIDKFSSDSDVRKYVISMSIHLIGNLIKKIQNEMHLQLPGSNARIIYLQNEVSKLQMEMDKLIALIRDHKKSKENVIDKKTIVTLKSTDTGNPFPSSSSNTGLFYASSGSDLRLVEKSRPNYQPKTTNQQKTKKTGRKSKSLERKEKSVFKQEL